MVNVILKCGRCIAESKWCDQHFIESKLGDECCEPLMALSNLDPVECSNHIEFCKVPGITKCIECFMDQR